eukprot:2388471-Pyramimonas_sp.AAC.1
MANLGLNTPVLTTGSAALQGAGAFSACEGEGEGGGGRRPRTPHAPLDEGKAARQTLQHGGGRGEAGPVRRQIGRALHARLR